MVLPVPGGPCKCASSGQGYSFSLGGTCKTATHRQYYIWQVPFLSDDLQALNSLNVADYIFDQMWAVLLYLDTTNSSQCGGQPGKLYLVPCSSALGLIELLTHGRSNDLLLVEGPSAAFPLPLSTSMGSAVALRGTPILPTRGYCQRREPCLIAEAGTAMCDSATVCLLPIHCTTIRAVSSRF